jgi:phospholipid/cholesterol/gamma-HCH transport system ATP-binding protein
MMPTSRANDFGAGLVAHDLDRLPKRKRLARDQAAVRGPKTLQKHRTLNTPDSAVPADSSDVAIDLRDVRYAINGRQIFAGLDMRIRRGQITAIMGPSGVGKTTLLRLITGPVKPHSGQIIVEGSLIDKLSAAELRARRLRMGVVFQDGALFTDLDAFENVAFPLREHTRLPEALVRLTVLMKLHIVGLRGAAGLMPAELSGGMARRGRLHARL